MVSLEQCCVDASRRREAIIATGPVIVNVGETGLRTPETGLRRQDFGDRRLEIGLPDEVIRDV
jgi:hypothetical protein